jgi:hypothetical protein
LLLPNASAVWESNNFLSPDTGLWGTRFHPANTDVGSISNLDRSGRSEHCYLGQVHTISSPPFDKHLSWWSWIIIVLYIVIWNCVI